MNHSTPGFPVLQYLLKFAQIHVHWVGDAIQPSLPLSPPSPLPSIFPSIRVFPMSQLFISGGQNIGASASASVLPVNIQGWFPLALTGLISLLSKGLSRGFSSTTIQKHQFFSAWLYGPTLTSIHNYWKSHAAAAKSLQSCLILYIPTDGSPLGSPVPEILQARTLEWVAISFSNAWEWKVKVKSLSRVWPLATPQTAAYRLLCPWDFPGKSTGVGCHCLLRGKAIALSI